MTPFKVVKYVNDLGEIRVRIQEFDDAEGTYAYTYGDRYDLTVSKPNLFERALKITWEDKIKKAIDTLNKRCEELTTEHYIRLAKIDHAKDTLKNATNEN
jgi:hypothetical protein